jgi:FtsH-binding integral membrane protein
MPAPPSTETAYDGPPIPPAPLKVGEAAPADVAAAESDERLFLQQVFAFIAGALAISALFAAYMDRYRASLSSFLAGQVIYALIGGLLIAAGLISRKIEKLPASVAVATLVGYSAVQGALLGYAYGAAYLESLAPVYLAIGAVFAGVWLYGRYAELDLTSVRSFLIGSGLALAVAWATEVLFDVSLTAAIVIFVVSVLMLALSGYHRDFLRDLPSSFDDDPGWRKAAAVGALQIYLDLIVIVIIIIQLRWFYAFIEDEKRENRRKFGL